MRTALFTALLIGFTTASIAKTAEQPPLVPGGAPLNKSKAVVDQSGNLVVEFTAYVPVSVKRLIPMDGVVKEVIEVKKVQVQKKRVVLKRAFQAFNKEGKPISTMGLRQELKNKFIVLIRSDQMQPTAELLKQLGDDTLLVLERSKKPASKPLE